MQVDVGEEQLLAGQLHVVGDPDVADVAAGPGGADGLHHRLLGADGLDDRVRAEPAGEVLDPGDAVVAALGDDVGGAELPGEPLPGLVPAHGDDPLGAELLGGQHAEQADGAVTDHGDGLAGAGLGGDGGEPAGAEHVGGGQQARDQVVVGQVGGGDQGAVGERDAQPFGLGAVGGAGLGGGRRSSGSRPGRSRRCCRRRRTSRPRTGRVLTVVTCVADLLDDAGVLVAHRPWPVDRLDAAVGPQVRPADAGRREPDDRVGRLDDLRFGAVLDPDLTRGGHHGDTHHGLLRVVDRQRLAAATAQACTDLSKAISGNPGR